MRGVELLSRGVDKKTPKSNTLAAPTIGADMTKGTLAPCCVVLV